MQSESKSKIGLWPDTKRLLGTRNGRGMSLLLSLTLISGCAITNYNSEAINDDDRDFRYHDRPALDVGWFEIPTSR